MNEQRNHRGLLWGHRVLDLTDEKGPLCGKILGDLGADVIKVERPGGDPARDIGPFYKDRPDPEKSLFWFFTNLNKRGITLNLEAEDGRDIFRRLVKTAHFVIESNEPGYMASLGLGYPELEKVNPAIIMTSITPYGQTGPYAHYEATDITLVGMGAMMQLYGYPDRAPVRISQPQAFFLGSLHGVVGSMMAHYYRGATGEGQYVDVSCQQAVILSLMTEAEYWDMMKVNIKRQGPGSMIPRPEPLGVLFQRRVYPCRDGYVIWLPSGGAQAGQVASCQALTRAANRDGYALELKDYDWTKLDYATVPRAEVERVTGAMASFLVTKTRQELLDEAVREDILLVPFNDARLIMESPQLKAREFFIPVAHPELGESVTYPGFPIKMTGFPYEPQRRAPLIGEHNEDIYIGELGFNREQLGLLKARGVI